MTSKLMMMMPEADKLTETRAFFLPVSNSNANAIANSPGGGGTHSPATAPRKSRRRRRRGAPSTPLLHWTFYNNNNNNNNMMEKKEQHHYQSSRAGPGARHVELSARKLAAGLWQLRLLRCANGGSASKRRSSDRFRFGLESIPSLPHSKSATEGATKWDNRCSKTSINEAYCFVSHVKFLEDQVKTMSFASLLQEELMQAQLYIHDLESEVRSSRKKIKYLLRKLGEEGILSKQKNEHDNVYALIDDLKSRLGMERKIQKKMETINSQLVKDLADAKLSALQLLKKYEEENRTRRLMEEVCNELAKRIGEDKAEVEALRIETLKIREEVEEEREMLHMAEILREERVQMKLIDAKLALESKYSQMNKLITVLETFLRSRSTTLDAAVLSNAELIIGRAVKSVNITEDMEEFSYESLRSRDIKFEQLQQVEGCKRETSTSNSHLESPMKNDDDDNDYAPEHSSGINVDYHRVNHAENHSSSSYSLEESAPSINTVGGCKDCSNTEISEECPISAELSKGITSSAKLRISCASSSGYSKAISEEGNNGRLSRGKISSLGTIFPSSKSAKAGVRHPNSSGHWGSTNLVNPHIARGVRGCIVWPRGFQSNTSKAARSGNEKAQLLDTALVDR